MFKKLQLQFENEMKQIDEYYLVTQLVLDKTESAQQHVEIREMSRKFFDLGTKLVKRFNLIQSERNDLILLLGTKEDRECQSKLREMAYIKIQLDLIKKIRLETIANLTNKIKKLELGLHQQFNMTCNRMIAGHPFAEN